MPFWREFTTRVVAGLAGAGTAGVRAAEEEAAPGAAEEEAAPGAVAAEAALAAFALVAMRGWKGREPRAHGGSQGFSKTGDRSDCLDGAV